MENNKVYGKIIYVWLLVLAVVLIALDQLTKYLAVVNLKGKNPFVIINGALELRYLENNGAAFSMMQNMQIAFTIITIVFILAAVVILCKIPKTKYYLPMMILIVILFSGAIGNFIDRLMNKYVVDFVYFSLIDFPIFNVADIYVSCSVIVLVLFVLFKYKEKDLDFISFKKKDSK